MKGLLVGSIRVAWWNLAAALNELHGGLGPELLGVAEVEGDKIFEELIAETGNTHLRS
jgi:hypothetical protein